jgi:hypothetical protein
VKAWWRSIEEKGRHCRFLWFRQQVPGRFDKWKAAEGGFICPRARLVGMETKSLLGNSVGGLAPGTRGTRIPARPGGTLTHGLPDIARFGRMAHGAAMPAPALPRMAWRPAMAVARAFGMRPSHTASGSVCLRLLQERQAEIQAIFFLRKVQKTVAHK